MSQKPTKKSQSKIKKTNSFIVEKLKKNWTLLTNKKNLKSKSWLKEQRKVLKVISEIKSKFWK